MKLPFASIVLIVFLTCSRTSFAQMTAKEFVGLPEADQRTALVSSLRNRENGVRNLQATSVTHIYNVEFKNGKRGTKVVEDVARYECELRRKDGNHWASVHYFTADDKPDTPTVKIVTTMDAKSSVARTVARHSGMNGTFGSISTEADTLVKMGHFHYWFDTLFDKPQEFPISFLLAHEKEIQFEGIGDAGDLVKVSLKYLKPSVDGTTPYSNVRTMWLDPQKGFLPARMFVRWQYDLQPPLYKETDTEVKKLEQIGDVWFPTHFIESTVADSSEEHGFTTIYETTVTKIELGQVTDEDLRVDFEKGTQVQDRLKGILFVANASTQEAPPPKPLAATDFRKWLILGNLVIILVVAVLYALQSRRRKSQSLSS